MISGVSTGGAGGHGPNQRNLNNQKRIENHVRGKSRTSFFLSASGYLGPFGVWLLSDVSYSEECRTKKYFQYAENMFPLLAVILKNRKH